MTIQIYWFRNDLRVADNPSFLRACEEADQLLPVFIHDPSSDLMTEWGFPRKGHHPKLFLQQSLSNLSSELKSYGSSLIELTGPPSEVFQKLSQSVPFNLIGCEQIEAPEEKRQVRAIENLGFRVKVFWQSSMIDPAQLPYEVQNMPDFFTQFRKEVEHAGVTHRAPVSPPAKIPPLPLAGDWICTQPVSSSSDQAGIFKGGETAALSHITRYFDSGLVTTYKQTRNQLVGMDYSSKFSPWLAHGCCSSRSIAQMLKQFETNHGANDGTYWLWFELLWRDYFRFLHVKHGIKLYRSMGLGTKPAKPFVPSQFQRWAEGVTGEPFVDAGMRELNQTGFLSNRMRQIVASFWIHDMNGDWRAGAAWFESQLIDYDVYSNQGNWLYIAGIGTDPRGGRAFNIQKQAQLYDPEGTYRAMWLNT